MQYLWMDGWKQQVVCCLLVVAAVSGLLFFQSPVSAQDASGEGSSGRSCGDCHLDFHDAWVDGVHAIAYDRESFQEAWSAEENDPACLQCHTTDFRPATGEYLVENIRCEACHDETPADHPPAPYVMETSARICGDCHTDTFDEWQHSLHAFNEDMGAIGCATCHNPHGQTLRFETVNGLCLNCHQDNPNNPLHYANTYVHLTHNEISFEAVEADVQVTCADCHMYGTRQDELHDIPNHTMDVSTRPCTACHEVLSETGQFDTLLDVDLALAEERDELRAQLDDLETQLSSIEEAPSQSGTSFVQLTQGIIVGLGIGITLIWVLLRRTNGNGSDTTD
jgi:predicted CXXCH cytochrome family protein